MVFGTPQKLAHVRPLKIYFGCHPIKQVDSTKYLGVTLDTYLSWTTHVDNLCKKISSRIGILKRIRPFIDDVSSNLIYSSTILPLFDYCDVVWDTCTINSKNKLQKLQNRAARIIQKSATSNLTPSDTLLAQLNWCKLETRRLFHKTILMYKCQNIEVQGVNTNLMRHLQMHNYNTRRVILGYQNLRLNN